MKPIRRRMRGFALILALFLIVSLATIGAYLLTVSNVQVETGIMDEQGARAYQAARAGLDWGAYRVIRAGVCDPGPTTITFPVNVLSGFHAEVTCESFGAENEGGTPVTTYEIVSTGCNFTPCVIDTGTTYDATYVERQLQLTVAR
jgi:MSHA biogenesis protein MshP